MALRGRVVVSLAALVVLSSCGQTAPARCGEPSVRPSRVLVPDYYGVVAPAAGRAWAGGLSKRRPTVLRFAGGASIKLDSHTRLLSSCYWGEPCSVYVGLRPRSRTADWVYGIVGGSRTTGAGIDHAAVWDVGNGYLVMSSGLRLRLESNTAVPSVAELRTRGTLVLVTLDSRGLISEIRDSGCA